jgi:hypothetical protein
VEGKRVQLLMITESWYRGNYREHVDRSWRERTPLANEKGILKENSLALTNDFRRILYDTLSAATAIAEPSSESTRRVPFQRLGPATRGVSSVSITSPAFVLACTIRPLPT